MFAKWIDDDQRYAFSLENNGGMEITNEDWSTLLVGQSEGKIISKNAHGVPFLKDVPLPSDEEILLINKTKQAELQLKASQAMTPLLLSLQLGNASNAEKELAKLWQAYSRDLSAVDLSAPAPTWPTAPI
ncbi:virus tail fibre assembly protein, lambda gpK [Pseudomonas antarctica]|uniref:Caudovirales tail fiber assembly protein n=1 Tax=Pseudomonas antarctica TaxID=219572 RepID=A0A1G9YD25_9PSED|nr:tail fiber assembly protein [Pseudomonas antarctica]KAF2410506.1 caudovirales tail fiber assembly protein [Pseudomonas antarctica]SDN07052.1 virus tail fibre assembly protein, lambda gpK [Pseudomonas antarctica]